ncbi:hypothetical protein BDW59DRAFT_166605 [Aspergillus cavernicola]|uniref:Uncharacterized protein n=1 Tax=Aspergillus cavernicola TaxID=176166 RepID=A0ABR4HK57_9EURO
MAGEYSISSIALAFTSSESNLRKLCLLCLLLLGVFEIRLLSSLPGPELLRGVFAFSCFVKLLHFISLFLLLRVEINQLVPPAGDSHATRLRAALNCLTSTRGIGTPWEVKTWSRRAGPPKGQYVARTLTVLVWQYMALDLLNFGAVRYFHREWPGILDVGAEFLSSGLSKEQLIVRLPLSCLLVANLRLLFAAIYGVLALISVVLNLSSSKD